MEARGGEPPRTVDMLGFRLPNTAFGISLGLSGQAIMFKTMAMNYPFNESVSLDGAKGIWWFAVTVYVVLIVLWVPKVIFHRDMIRREYNHPSRFYFCLAPHLALLMIGIGMPADYAAESNGLLKTIWLICAFLQCAFANTTYSRWMQPHTHAQKHSGDWPEWAATRVPSFRFGKSSHGGGGVGGEGVDDGVEVEDEGTGVWDGAVVSGDDHGQVSIPHDPPRDHVEKVPDQSLQHASPPYLLSTVGWLLLTVLGQQLSLHGEWGLDLPMYTFGCGVVFYTLVLVSIMQTLSMHATTVSPALIMIIAPPSVACICIKNMEGHFGNGSKSIFGFSLCMLFVFMRMGLAFFQKPEIMGAYWAYVFPLGALGTAAINNAVEEDTAAASALAWVLIILAISALVLVGVRFSHHHLQVLRGFSSWPDPLFDKYQQARQNEDNSGTGTRRARPPSQPQMQPVVGAAVGGAGELATHASGDIEASSGGVGVGTAADQGGAGGAMEKQGEARMGEEAGLELATVPMTAPANRPREDSRSYDQVEV